ncbi:hypothetical protein DL96DRAFT_1469425 [Flagelloscypha sp. PMI_526]|nr:hypothetical protein DL96DRAFT_1469425 [Flagelloscypha sp. PMI_526]
MLAKFGVSDPFDSAHTLVSSPWSALNRYGLAILRLVIATYTLVVLCFTLAWDSIKTHTGDSFFSYFTHLTYIGICAYFFAAGVQTFCFARSGGKNYPLQKWNRVFQLFHVLLLSSVVTLPIVVTVVYWALLATPKTFSTTYNAWSALSVHALNTVFALIEICGSNIPLLPWLTLIPNILILLLYVAVAYISHETLGFYVYSFLDPGKGKGKVAAYLIGIAVGESIIFCLVQGLIVLRQRLSGQRRQQSGEGSVQTTIAASMSAESWEEVKVSSENVPSNV